MKTIVRFTRARIYAGGTALILAGFLSACGTAPLRTEPVGAAPAKTTNLGRGYLRVYSATEEHHADNTTVFRPHTDYWLRYPNGRLEWIRNHLGRADENPARVSLPAGSYEVLADSEDYGRVEVPVNIEPRETTMVYLDGGAPKRLDSGAGDNLARLPNGQILGWRTGVTNGQTLK